MYLIIQAAGLTINGEDQIPSILDSTVLHKLIEYIHMWTMFIIMLGNSIKRVCIYGAIWITKMKSLREQTKGIDTGIFFSIQAIVKIN